MKATVKYPGSKWSIANWIISHFPEHHSYLEPFFGSGAILFSKQRSKIETVNDIDGDVVNFFRCARRDPVRLAEIIWYMPYARDIYIQAADTIKKSDPVKQIDFDRAAMFAAKLMMGYGFRTNEVRCGFKRDIQGREASYAVNDWKNLPNRIYGIAERLRNVQIENRDAVRLIQEFNYSNVLIYADPPYVISSRSYQKGMYKHEMTDEDHAELLETLKRHSGPVILSGYSSPLYEDALKGWNRETTESRKQTNGKGTEVLWMNFEPNKQIMMELEQTDGEQVDHAAG